MEAIVIVLGTAVVLSSLWALLAGVATGGTAMRVAGNDAEHARIIRDLGDVKARFSNRSWVRVCIGLVIAVALVSFGAVGLYRRNLPFNEGAIGYLAVIVFGLVIFLYIVRLKYYTLQLHERGLLLTDGKKEARAAYYPDIAGIDYRTVTYTTGGVQGSPIARSLVISLHGGGNIEISNNFVRFGKIADTIQQYRDGCDSTERLAGKYHIVGHLLSDGSPHEITLHASSPQLARQEALHRHGIIVDSCTKVS